MKGYGLNGNLVELLQRVYTDNKAVVTWKGETIKPAKIKNGLRQGCPLSPLLLMIYVRQMEKRLEQSKVGVDMSCMQGGQKINRAGRTDVCGCRPVGQHIG